MISKGNKKGTRLLSKIESTKNSIKCQDKTVYIN